MTDLAIASLANMQALSRNSERPPEEVSRPFDAQRDGFVYSEAAAWRHPGDRRKRPGSWGYHIRGVLGGAFTATPTMSRPSSGWCGRGVGDDSRHEVQRPHARRH